MEAQFLELQKYSEEKLQIYIIKSQKHHKVIYSILLQDTKKLF